MIYTKINYIAHSILSSNYRLFIHLLIIFIIYSMFYGNKITFCMNDNPDMVNVPAIAETKKIPRTSHQVQALKNEIMTYVGSQVELLERIEKQEQEIAELKNCLRAMEAEKKLPDAFWKYRQDEFFYRDLF